MLSIVTGVILLVLTDSGDEGILRVNSVTRSPSTPSLSGASFMRSSHDHFPGLATAARADPSRTLPFPSTLESLRLPVKGRTTHKSPSRFKNSSSHRLAEQPRSRSRILWRLHATPWSDQRKRVATRPPLILSPCLFRPREHLNARHRCTSTFLIGSRPVYPLILFPVPYLFPVPCSLFPIYGFSQ
jgi:hypothetical protein